MKSTGSITRVLAQKAFSKIIDLHEEIDDIKKEYIRGRSRQLDTAASPTKCVDQTGLGKPVKNF